MNKIKQSVIILLLSLIFIACSDDNGLTPEQQVKAVVKQMETSLEDRNLSQLFEHVSDNYNDHKGNDKKALRRFAQIYTLRNQSIALLTTITSLEVIDQNTVAIEANVLMGAKRESDGNLLNQLSADAESISAVFQQEGSDWRLLSMSWRNLGAY